eukprot:5380139-Amphidinium_carterae.1
MGDAHMPCVGTLLPLSLVKVLQLGKISSLLDQRIERWRVLTHAVPGEKAAHVEKHPKVKCKSRGCRSAKELCKTENLQGHTWAELLRTRSRE